MNMLAPLHGVNHCSTPSDADEQQFRLACDYMDGLYGLNAAGNLVVVEKITPDKWHHKHFDVNSQRHEAAAFAFQKARLHNTYIAWATHDPVKAKNDRGNQTRSIKSALTVPGLALDIDLASGDHAAANLPNTPQEAAQLLDKAGAPMPSMILNSGGGLYPLWLFNEPFAIRTEADRARIVATMKAFENAVRVPFLVAGLKLDPIGDLSRILRVPGLNNAKYDVPVSYLMRRTERYDLAELEAFAPPRGSKSLVPTTGSPSVSVSVPTDVVETLQSSNLDGTQGVVNVLTACGFAAECFALAQSGKEIPEPMWKDLADVLVHLGPAGDLAFHMISRLDIRYDEAEAKGKLERARQFGPKKCATIEVNGCAACAKCLFAGNPHVGSPGRLADCEPGLLSLQSRWVQDTSTGLFFNPAEGRDKSIKDFDRAFASDIPEPVEPHLVFARSKVSKKVDKHEYIAGSEALFVRDGSNVVLNIWRAGGIGAASGNCDIILDHFRLILPDDDQFRHVINYLAHLVRVPNVKIEHALIFQTRQGFGKGAVGKLVHMLLGNDNVVEVFGGKIDGRFIPEMANKQALILDELDIADKAGGYNKLKRWITSEREWVERKGVDSYKARTACGTFIFTNQLVPLRIDKGDRRVYVIRNMAEPREPAYYARLFAAVDDPATVAAFRAYLDTIDLKGWSPKGHPPETEAKRQLEKLSATGLEQELRGMRDDEDGPFKAPVYMVNDVVEELRRRLKTTVNRQQVEELLPALGDRQLSKRPMLRDKRLRLWVWRDHERVEAMSSRELLLAYNPVKAMAQAQDQDQRDAA